MILLPIFAFIIYRIGKAFLAIFRLMRETRALRTLPWSYIVRLPRKNVWIAIAFASLAVGSVSAVGSVVLPSPLHRYAGAAALIALWLGLVSSWIRLLAQALRARIS